MYCIALAIIGLAYFFSPIIVEQDVHETNLRKFHLPVKVSEDYRDKIAFLRLWVSEDRGKTWKLHQEIPPPPGGTRFSFDAPADGLYWFALQVEYKDGKLEPPKLDAEPNQRVYVNADRRPVLRAATSGH